LITAPSPPDELNTYRFTIRAKLAGDPRSADLLHDAHALGLTSVTNLECSDLYFIEGQVSKLDLKRLAMELLSDPISQVAQWSKLTSGNITQSSGMRNWIVEVALRPGVTDPVAAQIVRACKVLGIQGVEQASTGMHFVISGEGLTGTDLHLLSHRLLANPTIQRYALGELEVVFPHPAESSGHVELLPIRELDDEGLLFLSAQRRAALDLPEMMAIREYFRADKRDPTDIELETIAQTWSEHCVHKTFKAHIEVLEGYDGDERTTEIDNMLRTYIRDATEEIAAPWVRSAFVDNAGIIDFDDQFEVSFKVETHNHPSAIEPFGGANTGIGGVIRDILGVSAKPIAATDVLCFGPQDYPIHELPEGVLHPRRIQSGVVAGVQDYGNKIGIPTVNGAILYDPGYIANPLVFCGCVGIAPKNSHPRQPVPGDRVIVLGGGTGRDGLRGATFSSMTMDAQTGVVSGASVQIGDPITEKGLIEVITRARDLRLYHANTDCGAGGLSSAVGEMARHTGAEVDLRLVRLKYAGLAPWEIWLSEAQERQVLAVPVDRVPQVQALCDTFNVQLTDIGAFNNTGRLVVHNGEHVVLNLANDFLHEGIPQRKLKAKLPGSVKKQMEPSAGQRFSHGTASEILLGLLSQPNIASKADVIRIYDHEVQGGTVVKPLTGWLNDGPSDGCVLKPIVAGGWRGIVLANGINPGYGKLDAYRMAISVVDEAVRNAVAVGADPERIALLDNFCWGDPKRPETLGSLVEAVRGCHDAALHYRTPFISGKDSLNNEYKGSDGQRHAIPPTLLISAIGIIEDVRRAVTMDLKEPGNALYLVGDHNPICVARDEIVPSLSVKALESYRALHQAMQEGLVRACHDLSEGGLAVAAAEMCIGGRLGLTITVNAEDIERALFGETNGCLLVEVRPSSYARFEDILAGLPLQRIGTVSSERRMEISTHGHPSTISLPVSDLLAAWGTCP